MISVKTTKTLDIYHHQLVNAAKLLMFRARTPQEFKKVNKNALIKFCKKEFELEGQQWSIKLDDHVNKNLFGLDDFFDDAMKLVDSFYWSR